MQFAKVPQALVASQWTFSMNTLLAALSADELQRVSSKLTWRPVKAGQVLQKHGDPISEVFFPWRGICSITSSMEDGAMVEVATVGREGFVGVEAALGSSITASDAIVQLATDPIGVMGIDDFRREMDRRGAFCDIVTRYSHAFMSLLMQSVACNGLHSAEQRCCRWLLATHDRVEHDEFALTHEFLAVMLGVRRPTVTLVMAGLARIGVVSHSRGRVRIVDRPGLEARSCECYRTVKAVFGRLLMLRPRPQIQEAAFAQ